jgi:hypothetical protein
LELGSYCSQKVIGIAGPEFGANYYGKNLIIDKSLYLLKISAARFHEHLSESLLRLGFKNTKHDPDLWMVEKASHYKYLVTYMDDILIWSKDLMAVIKSLGKTYMLKSLGTLEYCLGGNVEFFGESWKNQGLDEHFQQSSKSKISFRNLKVFLARISRPSRHP